MKKGLFIVVFLATSGCCRDVELIVPSYRDYLLRDGATWISTNPDISPNTVYHFSEDSVYTYFNVRDSIIHTGYYFTGTGASIWRGTWLGGTASMEFHYLNDARHYVVGVYWSDTTDMMLWRSEGGSSRVIIRDVNN
jgi:hypothetical protein